MPDDGGVTRLPGEPHGRKGLSLPRTLSVMVTLQCTAACEHCGTLSSPHAKGVIDLDTLLAAIAAARANGFANVVFTGGEATLQPRILESGIRAAAREGLPSRLVTNAFWARTAADAERRLAHLRDMGLNEINFSTGDQHLRFVPLERIVLATAAALRAGFTPCVMIEQRKTMSVSADILRGFPEIAAAERETGRRMQVLESPWMPLHPFETQEYADDRVTSAKNVAMRSGCDSVLQTYTLMPGGEVKSCCGIGARLIPELDVGRQDEEDFLGKAISRAESDFLKYWLRFQGPEKILAWCAEHEPGIDWEGMYAHRCQACIRLYKDPRVQEVILEHYREIVPEVLFSAWLDTESLPRALSGD